ncbi:MAG: TolC family protein [Rubripirellula sp.]
MPRLKYALGLIGCVSLQWGMADPFSAGQTARGAQPVSEVQAPLSLHSDTQGAGVELMPLPEGADALAMQFQNGMIESDAPPTENLLSLNLPSALARVGGQHPAVGFAQWRTQAAYAELQQAKVLWLPSIQAGVSFHHHDGNYQASNGDIVDVNRNSFQYGLGTGATGAGTTPRPGLVAQFHLADAIFQPKIAGAAARGQQHAASGVLNRQLLIVANAYTELLNAHQDARLFQESQQRTWQLSKLTADFAASGQGLKADADRMETESILLDNRVIGSQERIATASARLAQAISVDSNLQIIPTDLTVLPLELAQSTADKAALISTGLASRPELKESRDLVAAACQAHRREKFAPFVPSVLLGFSTGGFGGGTGNQTDNIDGRYDFDGLMSWEVRNLGLGERAARRRASARVQQAKFATLRVMDQVAREVSEAYTQIQFRRQQMEITQRAIQIADSSYQRNLERINDGEGLPLEVLQSVQALEQAQRAYLEAVVAHNQAQFQLQWALGWPITAPASVAASDQTQ